MGQVPPLTHPGVVDITQCSRCLFSLLYTRRNVPKKQRPFQRFHHCRWWHRSLTSVPMTPECCSQAWRSLQQRDCSLHGVWFPLRSRLHETDCLVPALVQTKLLLGWTPPGHRALRTFLATRVGARGRPPLSSPVTARFPQGKDCGHPREPPLGLNFSHSVAWLCLSSISPMRMMSLSGG